MQLPCLSQRSSSPRKAQEPMAACRPTSPRSGGSTQLPCPRQQIPASSGMRLERLHWFRRRQLRLCRPPCRDLRQTDDIEMSLLVRAARPLPIKMLAGEYERILKRR